MEKIKGKFFLPENCKKKKKQVNGTVEIQDNGICHLELAGILVRDESQPYLFLQPKVKVNIWGIVENGIQISLLECMSISATQHFGKMGMSVETYKVQYVLKSAWLPNINSDYFHRLSSKIEGLDQWVNISGGTESVSRTAEKTEAFAYRYEEPKPINFDLEDGLGGCFYFIYQKPFERFSYQIHQSTCIEFTTKKARSLAYFLEKLYHFAKFLNIVSNSVLGIEFITMTSHKNIALIWNNTAHYSELKLISVKENFPFKNINKDHHSFLVTYAGLKGNFEAYIKNWFALKSGLIKRVIDIVYECIEGKSKVRIHLFLAISQAAEGFYISTKGKRVHFNKMIRSILDDNSRFIIDPEGNKSNVNIADLSDRIKDLRNAFTHIEGLTSEEIKQTEIYFLTNLLRSILQVALLKQIGIEEDEIKVHEI